MRTNPGRWNRLREIRSRALTKDLALFALCAACYTALVVFLAPISFLHIQVRVANALMGLVPIFGMPAVYGLTLGIFLGNIISPLGPIDLFSAIPSFIGLFIIYKLRNRSVILGLLIYSLIISLWVALMLNLVLNLPYLITFVYVLIGVIIATVMLGYILYQAILKLNFSIDKE